MPAIELGTLQAEPGTLDLPDLGGFTTVTVTGSYGIQGDAPEGTVTFTLTQSVSNGGLTVLCAPLIVELDADGGLSVVLVATDDAGTAPAGVWYGVTEQITGAQPRDSFILVSATDAPTAALDALLPSTPAWQ